MTSRQIKDLIRNQAKRNKIDAQILLRNYMLNDYWREFHFQNISGTLF